MTSISTVRSDASTALGRYRCPDCGGVVTVLPGYVARHLHQKTETVEEALSWSCSDLARAEVPPLFSPVFL